MEERKLYRALGLDAGAGLEEIKKAYRVLAKQYHPDATMDPATGEQFRKVAAAYKILSLRERKRKYVDFPVKEASKRRHTSTPQDVHSLGKLVCEGKVAEMRAFAAKRLGFSGKKSAYPYLKKALFDPSEMVIIAAVEAIGRLEIVQSAPDLASLFSRGNRRTKLEILDAVEKIGRRGGFSQILVLGMQSADRGIRSRALSVFARIGKEGATNEKAE
ncbi:MAG: DnaJ domain-containing protein [Spirochaetaceae bacterium]